MEGVYGRLDGVSIEAQESAWVTTGHSAPSSTGSGGPHFNMGRILLMKERTPEAERAFRRALSYDPEYLPALRGLEYIRGQGLRTL